MLSTLKNNRSTIFTAFIGLFFILLLQFKASYSVFPILLGVSGLYFVIQSVRNKTFSIRPENKMLVFTIIIYFLLFVLSLILKSGKGSELDLPSRALLALPVLTLLAQVKIKSKWVINSMLIANVLAAITAIVQIVVFNAPKAFPKYMHIQSGDIAMTIALFALCIALYFYQTKNKLGVIFASISFFCGLVASFLTTARGSWVGFAIAFVVFLFIYRHTFSKKVLSAFVILGIILGGVSYKLAEKNWDKVDNQITKCLEKNKCKTSIGGRLDMWKSAVRGIEEKPIFGWGLKGVKEMRVQHYKEGYITKFASEFDHAHNQFLQDTSARGIFGLITLLSIFLVPLALFWKGLSKTTNQLSQLFGKMGIIHIVATMGYCLTQSFLSHNSGTMFYFFTVVILLGLQRATINENQ